MSTSAPHRGHWWDLCSPQRLNHLGVVGLTATALYREGLAAADDWSVCHVSHVVRDVAILTAVTALLLLLLGGEIETVNLHGSKLVKRVHEFKNV